MKRIWFTLIGALSAVNLAAAAVSESVGGAPASVPGAARSAGQAVMEGKKDAVVERLFTRGEPSSRISLTAMPESELKSLLGAANAKVDERSRVPLQIGVGRDVPAAQQKVALESLSWQLLADGRRAATVSLNVAGAVGMRIGYRVTGPVSGMNVRFAQAGNDTVHRGAPLDSKNRQWSPTIEGDSGVMEIVLDANVQPSAFTLSVEKVSQLAMTGGDLKGASSRSPALCPSENQSGIGCAGSCNIDLACVINPRAALLDAARATMRYTFIKDNDGRAFLCTGTLINSNASPRRPYIFTAAHCVNSQTEAASMETYWFFDAIACNNFSVPPFQRLTTGASLRESDENMDVSLVEMNDSPPNGAVFASWDATIVPRSAIVVGLHHAAGDLKLFSEGTTRGYGPSSFENDSFIRVGWTPGKGTTEQGSSGSGIFTYNENCGGGVACYQLRGGLQGGAASCSNTAGIDRYSRMDLLFTRLAPYLSPGDIIPTTNSTTATMVEYFNPRFDYYFMTSRENEKSLLDTFLDDGYPAWYRTGYWFKTDAFATPSTNSLTRYFIPGAAKGGTRATHFYTALTSDKQLITGSGRERFGSACNGMPNGFFCNEGTDSYVAPPIGANASATCAAGERRIWRVFRGTPNYVDDGNHRYVGSEGLYAYMTGELGWNGEFVNMCVRP
jgi:lysyl endopeptidase